MDGRAKSGRAGAGADLVVFKANSSERLKMSIGEEDVRLLDVEQRRKIADIISSEAVAIHLLVRGELLLVDRLKAIMEESRSHEHTILLAVIGDNSENATRSHFKKPEYIMKKTIS